MRKSFTIFLFLLAISAFSQEDAWVYFNDKPNAGFYLSNPSQMLSQRALERRVRQNIAVDMLDVPIYQPYVDLIGEQTGLTVMAKSKWLNALHIRGSVQEISNLTSLEFVNRIDFANDALDSAANRLNIQPAAVFSPHNQTNSQTDFSYGLSENQIHMLNGHVLHNQGFTGQGKIIAVLDAGFPGVDQAEPFARLRDNDLLLGGYDFVNKSPDFYTLGNHGTMVLSTMGGFIEGELVGTAPDAGYYLFITEDIFSENPVEESYWVEAAELADSLGVDIINTSLGYFGYDNPQYSYSYSDMNGEKAFITRAADIAFSRGMVVVASAGNSGAGADPHIGAPADGFNVLSIGAVTPTQNYASFSSIGPTADSRVKPDVTAQGQACVVALPNGALTYANGTSFSGPIIAGMVASLWQALPDLTNAEIIALVKQSADLYQNPTVQKGYGIPDFALALQNALSVTENKQAKILLYPNPVIDLLTISLSNETVAKVKIYSALGQLVVESEISKNLPQIDCSSLQPGIYLFTMTSQSGSTSGKFIKN